MDDQMTIRDYTGAVTELEAELEAARAQAADQERRIADLEANPPPTDYPALADQLAEFMRARGQGAK